MIADRLVLYRAIVQTNLLYRSIVARHSIGDLSALEGGPGRAGSSHHAMPVADDDLSIRADIYQHHHILLLVQTNGQKISGHISAYVATDQRASVYFRGGEDSQAQVICPYVKCRRVPLAGFHLMLDYGFVGPFANRLHVQPKKHIAHRRVADDDDLVDSPLAELQAPAHFADLKIHAGDHHLLQLATKLSTIVGDAMHDVAAAESLRILKRSGVHDIAGLQVDQVHDYSGSAHVDGYAKNPAAILVNTLIAEVDTITSTNSQRVRFHITPDRFTKDLWLTTQKSELDLGIGIDDGSLARQSIVLAQKALGLRCRRERLHTASDLNDALMTFAGPAARSRHSDLQAIGVVENGFTDFQDKLAVTVIQG